MRAETACRCPPRQGAPRGCPDCGRPGRAVGLHTLQALLVPEALAKLGEEVLRFCSTPDCPVVYFGATQCFDRGEIATEVFQKEPPGQRTVCYCFAIGEEEIAAELAATGTSTVVERISELVRAGRCACELKNPQGSCCLGNVARVVEEAKREAS